jgi:hypothetical protein
MSALPVDNEALPPQSANPDRALPPNAVPSRNPRAEADVPAGASAKPQSESEIEARLSTPAQRLQQSRDRIAKWMIEADGRHIARRRAAARAAGRESGWAWLGALRNNPVVALFIDALSSWWANHPLHSAADLAQGIAHEAITPLARRHPKAMVAGAVLAGALIVWARPWRWLMRPALLTGILSQIASQAVAHMPMDSILNALATFMARREARDEPPAPGDVAGVDEHLPAQPAATVERAAMEPADA